MIKNSLFTCCHLVAKVRKLWNSTTEETNFVSWKSKILGGKHPVFSASPSFLPVRDPLPTQEGIKRFIRWTNWLTRQHTDSWHSSVREVSTICLQNRTQFTQQNLLSFIYRKTEFHCEGDRGPHGKQGSHVIQSCSCASNGLRPQGLRFKEDFHSNRHLFLIHVKMMKWAVSLSGASSARSTHTGSLPKILSLSSLTASRNQLYLRIWPITGSIKAKVSSSCHELECLWCGNVSTEKNPAGPPAP